ncbi:hypothetical protein [Sphingosinicella humi]|uniref:Peptidoglycan endopeptidase n=1 Tax=Allosphingosinicella humi TaxID=2068657 RepID=A0A2U2J0H2_9SPHN|nr:hypothetical protein [Sphingosinicella humi]PWG01829.1 hypothetical protein DF286_02280 [Sphingosinicella humi]
MRTDEIVARARALVGARFRPQGRSAEQGLDCIGVVAVANGLDGVRSDYCLRSSDASEVHREFKRHGFIRVTPTEATEGNVLLVRPGPGRLHAVLLTREGYLHADMGLRRVVEVPGAVPWPILSAWGRPERNAERHAGTEARG